LLLLLLGLLTSSFLLLLPRGFLPLLSSLTCSLLSLPCRLSSSFLCLSGGVLRLLGRSSSGILSLSRYLSGLIGRLPGHLSGLIRRLSGGVLRLLSCLSRSVLGLIRYLTGLVSGLTGGVLHTLRGLPDLIGDPSQRAASSSFLLFISTAAGQAAHGVLRLLGRPSGCLLGLARRLSCLVGRLSGGVLRLLGGLTCGVLDPLRGLTGLVNGLTGGFLSLPGSLSGCVLCLLGGSARCLLRSLGSLSSLVGDLPRSLFLPLSVAFLGLLFPLLLGGALGLLGRLVHRVFHSRVLGRLIERALDLRVGVDHLLDLCLCVALRDLLGQLLELVAVALDLALDVAHRVPVEILGRLQVLVLHLLLEVLSFAHFVSLPLIDFRLLTVRLGRLASIRAATPSSTAGTTRGLSAGAVWPTGINPAYPITTGPRETQRDLHRRSTSGKAAGQAAHGVLNLIHRSTTAAFFAAASFLLSFLSPLGFPSL